jgi:hypothetical protein
MLPLILALLCLSLLSCIAMLLFGLVSEPPAACHPGDDNAEEAPPSWLTLLAQGIALCAVFVLVLMLTFGAA